MVDYDFTPAQSNNNLSANEAVEQFFGAQTVDIPEIDGPGIEEIELPAGLLTKDGELETRAVVRELTGEDEEALAKALDNPSRFFTVLLERGVSKIGDEKPTKDTFAKLLTGDRAALVLGIRRATYGDEVETRAFCPTCGEWVDVSLELNEDVPVTKLENPQQREYEIELRKGGKAVVQLLDGAIEEKVLANDRLNQSQRDTLVLSLCVRTINNKPVLGTTGPVLRLGMADRRKIIEFLGTKTFGPDYNGITFEHDVCGKEVSVPLNAGDLFRF